MDFFERNSINPFVPFENSAHSLTVLINKRMDAVEQILREMEREQLKPTKKLLESLFKKEEKKIRFVERKIVDEN